MQTTPTQPKQGLDQPIAPAAPTLRGGLSVRTNLRAGLAWDDLDDQAAALWGKLTDTVSSLTSGDITTSA